jgi:DNA polymerase III subunit alpha
LGMKRTKGMQVRMPMKSVNKALIGQIEAICNEFSGSTPLFVTLKDSEENITLDLLSRKMRVKPVNEFVKKMREIPEIEVGVM